MTKGAHERAETVCRIMIEGIASPAVVKGRDYEAG
jgi:hypothetical protein